MTLGAAAILFVAAGFWAGKSLTTATQYEVPEH
jgi:hypothetical protein